MIAYGVLPATWTFMYFVVLQFHKENLEKIPRRVSLKMKVAFSSI